MFFSLLTTTTKTAAANSSTTLVSSYRMVCQNSESNLNNTHRGKKKYTFIVHTIIYVGLEKELHSILTSKLDHSEQSALYPSCFTTRKRPPYPPPPTLPHSQWTGCWVDPTSKPACDKNQTTTSWLLSQYPIHYTDYTITNPTQEPRKLEIRSCLIIRMQNKITLEIQVTNPWKIWQGSDCIHTH
jgi:hypothetical protein